VILFFIKDSQILGSKLVSQIRNFGIFWVECKKGLKDITQRSFKKSKDLERTLSKAVKHSYNRRRSLKNG
jgi:hypothetical protein